MRRTLFISAAIGAMFIGHAIADDGHPTFQSLHLHSPLATGDGGTGANNPAGARAGIGAAASGANGDINSLSGLTTPLSPGQGGTGVGTFAPHQAIISTSPNTLAPKTVPDCGDAAGNHLNYAQSSDSFSCGTTASPPTGSPFGNAQPLVPGGAIVAGGSPQTAIAARSGRFGCSILNESKTDLWINELGTAAPSHPSIWLPPGAEWRCEPYARPNGAISVYGSATGQQYAARDW